MTNKFTKNFPELKEFIFCSDCSCYIERGCECRARNIAPCPDWVIPIHIIQTHCLSKQKVLKARIKLFNYIISLSTGRTDIEANMKKAFEIFDEELK